MICPKCNSKKTKEVDYRGAKCIFCQDCGFDEREELDAPLGEKETQREKRRFTPYRAGRK